MLNTVSLETKPQCCSQFSRLAVLCCVFRVVYKRALHTLSFSAFNKAENTVEFIQQTIRLYRHIHCFYKDGRVMYKSWSLTHLLHLISMSSPSSEFERSLIGARLCTYTERHVHCRAQLFSQRNE